VRFVLKDGTEIHRLPPPEPVYDYNTGEIIGFSEDFPPIFRPIFTGHDDWFPLRPSPLF
jgi:hypothetical protein